MYRLFFLLWIYFLCQVNGFAQEKFEILWQNDTAWYVNPNYDPNYDREYKPEITFPALSDEYGRYQIDWGIAGVPVHEITDPSISFTGYPEYPGEGIYNLVISLFRKGNSTDVPDKVVHKKIMNRRLEASFRLEPENSRRCMEWGGDSILLILTQHNNPEETRYEIQVSSDVEKTMSGSDTLFCADWINADSAWITMKKPTGIFEARVYIRMKWEMHGVTVTDKTYKIQTFNAYHAPDVRDIFDFADTLATGEELKNFTICTDKDKIQSYIQLDSMRLGKYQYHAYEDLPYYHSVNDRQDMEIRYFWTDETPDEHSAWQEVTGMYDFVDTTDLIHFKKAGFYKLRIEAHNRCNYDPDDPGGSLLNIDSLWTDSIKGSADKRYFQVFERATDHIICRTDSICGETNHVVLVDRNIRKSYDHAPVYEVTIDGLEKDRDYYQWLSIYKGGIAGGDGEAGCDSTEIHLVIGKTGNYNIKLVRKSDPCEPIEKSFRVYIGERPQVAGNTLLADHLTGLGAELLEDGLTYQKCDSFRYVLPQDCWINNNFDLDSVFFYMSKGSQKDTILNNRLAGADVAFYDFDSTGNTVNYIRLRAHNYCGWSEELSANFYTRTKPAPVLLRDSLMNNDSLCINFNYPYYWGGVLPEKYTVAFSFLGSGKAIVNGSYLGAGDEKKIQGWPVVNKFSYIVKGQKTEYYTISNDDMPACQSSFNSEMKVIDAPDEILYDTVKYCPALTVLETERLFDADHKLFKYAEWKWNRGTSSTDQFPHFPLMQTADDTLYYKLSNSRGCFRSDTVILHPEELPMLELKDDGGVYCLPDTIRDFVHAPYIDQLSTAAGFDYAVYREFADPSQLQCNSATGVCHPLPLTGKPEDYTLVYVVENNRIDTAFAAGCRLEKPVSLKLYSPQLEIQKADTLVYPWGSYDFTALKGYVDTARLNPLTLRWTPVNGTETLAVSDGGDKLFGVKYTLSAADQVKDTLLFQLSGQSICGDELRDTLVLVMAHIEMKGYKDTLCENSIYSLWPKMESHFVDESSVEWEICYPVNPAIQGTLSQASGVAVTYTPAKGTDSVRIAVKGALEGYPLQQVKDTVVLLINPEPIVNLLQGDTLFARNNEINLRHIAGEWLSADNVTAIRNGRTLAYNNGRWTGDTVYQFTSPVEGDPKKYVTSEIRFEGLAGCAAVTREMTFVNLTFAGFRFKHEQLQICAGDVLKLDTLYEKNSSFDRYTTLVWESAGSGVKGNFTPGVSPVYYESAAPSDGVNTLRLKTSKTYTAYDGTLCENKLVTVHEMPLIVHQQPVLNRVYGNNRDTLCREDDRLIIARNRIDVSPARYQDSLRLNGSPFIADINYRTMAAAGQPDTLIFTVSQGGCTRWNESDTLFIYRLPQMITGTFSVGPVCEKGSIAITPGPGELVHPLAADVSWRSSGGNLNTEGIPVFIPVPGAEQGSVTLHVQPPHGCPEDTLRRELDIYRLPELILQADTVCRIPGQKVNIPVTLVTTGNYSGLDKIDWFRKGESVSWKTTTGATGVEYEISRQDSVAGFVEIVAQARANGICDGLSGYDTVRITLQDPPKVILLAAGIPDLCQTASLNLGNFIGFDAVSDIGWSLKTAGTGSLTGSLYSPGEYFGHTVIQAHVKGWHGCPDVTGEIPLNVIYTPEPQLEILSGTTCQSDTILFRASAPVAATWEWDAGDGNVFAGEQMKHGYAEAGRYTVRLTAEYGICTRTKEVQLDIHEKPEAIFHPEPEVALGQSVSFTSASLPENVACEWVFEDGKTMGQSCMHTFTGATGYRKVELWIKTEHGCVDSVSHVLLAVDVPVPDFELNVNPCSGEVEITNHSSRNHAEAEWDFGNGTPVSSVWDPRPVIYERTYQDTVYYITLTLKNAAGTPSLKKEVKLISKLEAGVEVMPATDGCNKPAKEIHILNRGVADSVRVWWGDGSYECWGGDQQVVMRKHRYTNEGTEAEYFPLRLAAENSCEKDTTPPVAVAVYPIAVKAKLIADPAYTNECFGNERGFQNKSFGFVPEGYTCEWQFEPDQPVVSHPEPEITWLYERPGEYMVRLKVRDNCNEDTDSLRIIVHGNDSLDFEFAPGPYCSEKDISMNVVPHGKDESGDFRWTFPDGRTRQGRQAEYSFSSGEQWIELSAKADGCPSLVRHRLVVHESPVPLVRAEDDITTGCQPFEVKLYGRNAAEQETVKWWDFKDGSYSNQADIVKTFDEPGVYPVSFRLETAEGCVDSAVIPVSVLYTPEISVRWSEKLFCTSDGNFEVEGTNTSADLANCSFEWWQGKQLVSLQPDQVRLSFRDVLGKTEVRLKGVHKQSRCAVEISDTIVSSPAVKAVLQIHPVSVCEGAPVLFKDISAGGKYTSMDLGDGNFTEEQEFEYVYEESGQYPVKLRVENPDGCRDSIEQLIDVHPLPVADFSWSKDHRITGLPDTLKLPETDNGGVQFTNHSSYTDIHGMAGGMVYKWNFGDSTAVSAEVSPAHVFPNNGLYEVWLYVQTASGCRDSISDAVNIDAVKGLYFPNAFAPGTADEGVNRFQPKGVGLYRYSIKVYDKRGMCVWSSDRLKDGKPEEYWDGTFNGQPLPKGIYTWDAEAVFIDGTVYEKDGGSGYVILIR